MRIIKEAVVGTTTFSLTPEYFAISGKDEVGGADFKVILAPADAVDLVVWLNSEMFASKPLALIPGKSMPIGETKPQPEQTKATPKKEEAVYDPGERSFIADKQTPPLIKSVSGGTGNAPIGPEVVTVG